MNVIVLRTATALIITSSVARANSEAVKPKMPAFAEAYSKLIISELRLTQVLEKRIADHDRKLCPNLKSSEMGSCVKEYLKLVKIDSALHYSALMKMIVLAMTIDLKSGVTLRDAQLVSIDSILTLSLRLNTSQFFLANAKVQNDEDRKVLSLFVQSENGTLAKIKDGYRMEFIKVISRLESQKRAPASNANKAFSTWEASALEQVKRKFEDFKRRDWNMKFK